VVKLKSGGKRREKKYRIIVALKERKADEVRLKKLIYGERQKKVVKDGGWKDVVHVRKKLEGKVEKENEK